MITTQNMWNEAANWSWESSQSIIRGEWVVFLNLIQFHLTTFLNKLTYSGSSLGVGLNIQN